MSRTLMMAIRTTAARVRVLKRRLFFLLTSDSIPFRLNCLDSVKPNSLDHATEPTGRAHARYRTEVSSDGSSRSSSHHRCPRGRLVDFPEEIATSVAIIRLERGDRPRFLSTRLTAWPLPLTSNTSSCTPTGSASSRGTLHATTAGPMTSFRRHGASHSSSHPGTIATSAHGSGACFEAASATPSARSTGADSVSDALDGVKRRSPMWPTPSTAPSCSVSWCR